MATVELTDQDIDFIGRVVATEVPHELRMTNPREYQRMVGAVVDTMANRLAVGRRYGTSIREVANQRRAFSKITGPRDLNPYGSVENTPKAPSSVQNLVNAHIAKRAQGVPSEVPGALDYANPFHSDESNLRGWVNPMIDAGALKLGVGKSVHYHGLAPGNRPAPNVGYRTPAGFMPEIEPGMKRQLGIPTPSPRPSTPEVERQAEQRATLAGTGVLGLDGRQSGTFSAPSGTVTRGPALQAALERLNGTPTANGYAQMERSRRPQSENGQTFAAPVSPVERRALPAVGASTFPARPAVIASNNTRTATPALDKALEQRGIARPTPTRPQTSPQVSRDPSSLPSGTYPGRVVGDGIAPTFAGQQQSPLTSNTPVSSFPARPSVVAPNTRPALQKAMRNAGLVTPGDPSPQTLSPSLDSQQLSPVAGAPVRTVQTRPVEVRAVPRPVPPTQVAPVAPRPVAPVQIRPRVITPVQQPPQPVAPVNAPLSQEAFNARANPVTAGLRAGDIYAGQTGSALASGGNVVSRENSWGPTTVTNKYGVTTATMPDGKQAATGSFNPFGKGTMGPQARSMLGGLAGGLLGSLAGGPAGGLMGGLMGRSVATGGLSGNRTSGGLGGLMAGFFGGNNNTQRSSSQSSRGSQSSGGSSRSSNSRSSSGGRGTMTTRDD